MSPLALPDRMRAAADTLEEANALYAYYADAPWSASELRTEAGHVAADYPDSSACRSSCRGRLRGRGAARAGNPPGRRGPRIPRQRSMSGMAGVALRGRRGSVRLVVARQGVALQAWIGRALLGWAGRVQAWRHRARLGLAGADRLGGAGSGSAGLGMARFGVAGQARFGSARHSTSGQGSALHGMALRH